MNGKNEKFQLFRFCLYGFLKNQLYFEPFLILAFREKGFSFTAIGALMAFRAISVNLMEIPSGAAADVWGRRRSMIVSMCGYIASFIVFALAETYWFFFPAMLAFAIGEAFRTGTHKAMIFDWLEQQGRLNEKTKVYGVTRSWSKIGSVLNSLISAGIVICTQSYIWVFWVAIIPYLLNIVNFLFYPAYLDRCISGTCDFSNVWKTLRDGIRQCTRLSELRRLIFENVCFEGYYAVAEDYLQPLLKAAALAAPVLLALSGQTRTAMLVALVYALLNLLGSAAARNSHRVVERMGGELPFCRIMKILSLCAYGLSAVGLFMEISLLPILGFITLGVLLDLWKPVFLSRFYDSADQASAATTLSIANQSKTLSVAVMAPLLGMAVDYVARSASPITALWPVAVAGVLIMSIGLLIRTRPSA